MSNEDKTTDPLLEVLARVRSIDTRVANVESRLGNVEARLDSLETKVEERGRETRPMWEQALKEIMDSRLESNQRFAEMDRRFVEMGKDIKSLSRKIDILHDDVFNVRESHVELQERISALESNTPTERLK